MLPTAVLRLNPGVPCGQEGKGLVEDGQAAHYLNGRRLQQGDLVLAAQLQEARHLFGEIHNLLD